MKEDIEWYSKEFKKDGAEIKNEFKIMCKDASPVLGKVVEGIDELGHTVNNALDSLNPVNFAARIISTPSDLQLADHIITQYPGFTHHGLYVGEDDVIHYSNGVICLVPITEFGVGYSVVDSPIIYKPEKVIERAYSRMYEREYNVLFNNCEHFVRWCRSGT